MNFKKWTIGKKLWFLSIVLMSNILIVGIVDWIDSSRTKSSLYQISQQDLPAVRMIGLIDMFHEGTQAVVYNALFAASKSDFTKLKEIEAELVKIKDEFKKHIAVLEKIDLNSDFKIQIENTKPQLSNYIKIASEIVENSLNKKESKAQKLLPSFQEAFEKLEVNLVAIGENIEKTVRDRQVSANADTQKAIWVKTVVVFLVLFTGITFSYFLINSLVSGLTNIMNQLLTQSNHLQTSSKKINSASQQLSEATTEHAAAIEEAVSSMEEMTAMLSQTAQQASECFQIAEVGQSKGEESKIVIQRLSVAMDEIQASNNKLEDLVALIEEIKSKTTVINDIVFETRLLAFNASIEAARAGAHGKGFAVVAEEVGKLALMSGRAADEIKTLLDSSTKEVVQIVKQTQDRVVLGKNISQECENVFRSVGNSLRQILDCIKLINSATKEQEAGVKQTNQAMSEMDQVTQTNSQGAERLATESGSLASASDSLINTIAVLQKIVFGGEANIAAQEASTSLNMNSHSKSHSKDHSRDLPILNLKSEKDISPVNKEKTVDVDRTDSRWRAS